HGVFSFKWWLLSIVSIMLIETGKHCFNDVVDYESGVDLSIEPDKVTPYSGGKKVLTENLLSVKEAKIIGKITLAIAAVIGIYIAVVREPLIWPIGILGVFFAISYSVPPFSFCYRGLGEIVIGITYGPLIFVGMYLVMAGSIDSIAVLASIPLGILVTNIIWINQYPDYEADKMHGKRNWVVRLGKEKGLVVYKILYIMIYLSFIIIAVTTRNYYWLINLVTIPMAIRSYRIAQEHYNNIQNLIKANELTLKMYVVMGITMIVTFILTY
ncbi:MAG: prenyltransferase, partial [Clostridiales bacterium]|nr:prenyltransferase [Clostridiales bacterium]